MPLCVRSLAQMRGLKKIIISSPSPSATESDPRRSLQRGFHELLAAAPGDETIALAFALSLAAMASVKANRGFCFCSTAGETQEHGRLYGHGLTALGISPGQLLTVTAPSEKNLLWTLEEAVTSGAFGAVVGALPAAERLYGFATSRRLKLRVTAKETSLFLIRPWSGKGATAAQGRWRVGALPGEPEDEACNTPLVGAPRLRLGLERMGGLPPQQWEMTLSTSLWEDEIDVTRDFHMAPLLADGSSRKPQGHQAA